jgi:hypothetical protein
MSTSHKAEASIEFLVFFGILLVFFVFFLGILSVKNNDINESTVTSSANGILSAVVNEINTASGIDGYHREFSIPNSLANGENYTINLYPSLRMVEIKWSNQRNAISNILTENVTGAIQPGTTAIKIKSENGVVKINES